MPDRVHGKGQTSTARQEAGDEDRYGLAVSVNQRTACQGNSSTAAAVWNQASTRPRSPRRTSALSASRLAPVHAWSAAGLE
jgi:hypothetical protein